MGGILIQDNMTEKDLQLIEQAEQLSCIFWDTAFELMEQAETDEARKRLRQIGIELHHREEGLNGEL